MNGLAYGLGAGLWFVVLFTILLVLAGIALYVLGAYGLYNIGKKNNVENPWMAWIPIVSFYVVGKIIKEYKVFNYSIPKLEWAIVILPIAAGLLGGIPVIGGLIWLASVILLYMFLHKFYYMMDKNNAILLLVFSIIFNAVAVPVIFFVMRNKVAADGSGYKYPFSNVNITVNKNDVQNNAQNNEQNDEQ